MWPTKYHACPILLIDLYESLLRLLSSLISSVGLALPRQGTVVILVSFTIVTLSPPNGTVSVCQGEVQTITCNVTGSVVLAWEYGGYATSFSSGNTDPQYIAPFSFILQSHGNGTLVSVATFNVSTSINGTSIECRNTIAVTGSSIKQQITFNVKRKILYDTWPCSIITTILDF